MRGRVLKKRPSAFRCMASLFVTTELQNIERLIDNQTYIRPMRKIMYYMALVSSVAVGPIFLTGCASSGSSTGPSIETSTDSASTSSTKLMHEQVRIPGSEVSFVMVPMSGGASLLGGDPGTPESMPGVEVAVSPFWIAETETSFEAFSIFRYRNRDSDSTNVDGKMLAVDAVARPSTPYEDPSHGMDGAGYPAVGITQWGALHYARWLSSKTGWFFRLPTEAEWEFACMAGQTEQAASGPALETVAWYKSNSEDRLRMIGTREGDAAGLKDMLGNVAEWTLDQYDEGYYAALAGSDSTVVDPWREPSKLHPRTVRGGSYRSDAAELTCKNREESSMRWKRRDPQIPKSFWWNTDSPFVGFRLVAPVNPPSEEEQAAFWSLVLGE